MGKPKPRVRALAGDKVDDNPRTTRYQSKNKMQKLNSATSAGENEAEDGHTHCDSVFTEFRPEKRPVAVAIATNRQPSEFTVATMKKFETRRTAIYNTPVKISSPGDIGLSQPEPMFEVGWDCHSPCDEDGLCSCHTCLCVGRNLWIGDIHGSACTNCGSILCAEIHGLRRNLWITQGSVNTCNVVEIMRTFAHEEHGAPTVHPSGTPPLLGLWIGSAFEDDPSPASRRLQNHSRFKKGRNMRPSVTRRAADSIALFQRLTTVLESHADTPELSPRRSARLIHQSQTNTTAESDSLSKTTKNVESEKFRLRSMSALNVHANPATSSPKPPLNRSDEDLWTDEEMFDNDSFIKATQELFTSEGMLSPKPVKQPVETSTPVASSKAGRYTFSLEPPLLSGIPKASQCMHGALVSSVEKVVKAIRRDHKVMSVAPKGVPLRSYCDRAATNVITVKPRSSEQYRKDTAPITKGCSVGQSADVLRFTPVEPTLSRSHVIAKCGNSTAAQTVSSCSRPASFKTCPNRPSSLQFRQNVLGPNSTGNVTKPDNLNGDHRRSKKSPPTRAVQNSVPARVDCTNATATIALHSTVDQQQNCIDLNFTDNSISDDLLAAVAEPDDLLDSQEYLHNDMKACGTTASQKACGTTASQASTVILSGNSQCDAAHGERRSKVRIENDSFTSDEDALSEPQLLAMLAEIESTQASEAISSTATTELGISQRQTRRQTKAIVQHTAVVPKPIGQVHVATSRNVGTSKAPPIAQSGGSAPKRCSPDEIQRKKADAMRRRKLRLGVSGINR